jgi:hypothetical protein
MNEIEYQQHVEWRDSLRKRFPELFPQQGYVDISVARGWQPLIEELLVSIQAIVNERGFTVRVRQVKEKFGGLRFYCEGSDDMIRALIMGAESSALCLCERCGGPGFSRMYRYWWKTLCDEHFLEWVNQTNRQHDKELMG